MAELCGVKESVVHIVSTSLVLLWVYAAGSKLLTYPQFAATLARQPLPAWSTGILSVALPVAELCAALLLCFQRTRRYGLALSAGLLLSFTVYTALALSGAYGSIPCSCGGIFSFMGWKGHLVFNGIALMVACSAWYTGKHDQNITINHKRKYYA